jgi:hypothetical protein
MATEMRLRFNTKERVLLGMTLLLAPIFFSEIYGVSVMRQRPAFHSEIAADMPQFADLWVAVGVAGVIIALRYVLTKMFQPLGRLVLAPNKRSNPERVARFATVLFKFLCVKTLAKHSLGTECLLSGRCI